MGTSKGLLEFMTILAVLGSFSKQLPPLNPYLLKEDELKQG